MKQILEQILDKQNLTRDEAFNVMFSIMSGEFDDPQIAGFLMALRAKVKLWMKSPDSPKQCET